MCVVCVVKMDISDHLPGKTGNGTQTVLKLIFKAGIFVSSERIRKRDRNRLL